MLKLARSLEARQPAEALELLRAAHDRFIMEQVFTADEEKQLFKPLADRMAELKEMIRDRQFRKLGEELYDYRDSIRHWSDLLEEAQKTGASTAGGKMADAAAVETTTPSLIAFRDGTFAYGLLRAIPPVRGLHH